MPLSPGKRPTKYAIIKHLNEGIVNFKFTKKDGEEREMNGTTCAIYINDPRAIMRDANPVGNKDDNLVVCWDVDNEGWRSFKIDTLEEYNGLVKR